MKKFSLFAALLAAGASVWAAGPENLLKNPGFETDSPDWLAWGIYRKLTPEERASILTFDTDMPGSGKRSMRVADRWTDDGPYMVQIVPFPAGKPLKLSFRARAPKGQEFRYGAQFGTGTGMRDFRYVDARYARGVGDGGWHEYELLLEPPAGATLVAAAFCPGSKTTAGTLWVDDAALRVLGEADEAAALGIDREPVFRENLPYQPADGSKPELNPTPFCWLPAAGWSPDKVTYSLEYSRDPAFQSADTVRRTGLAIHTEIPETVLEPGIWYWRYGVERPGKTVWSKTRRFEMVPGLPELPFPTREQLTANLPKTHPRLAITADRLPAFRERAANGDLRAFTENLKKSMAPHIGRELIAEPPFLPPWKDPKWSEMYTKIYSTTRPDMARMESFALLYLLTGDPVYGQEAKRRVKYFFGWDPKGSTSIFHNDEPARSIMSQGTWAYDWTYDLYTPEERAEIEKNLLVRIRENYEYLRRKPMDNNPYESHTHSFVVYMTQAAMAFYPEYPELWKEYQYGLQMFWAHFPSWAESDGGWNEGPGYWAYYVVNALRLVTDLRTATGIDAGKKPFWQNTPYYVLYGWPGLSKQAAFGDDANPRYQAMVLRDFAAYLGNPDFLAPALALKLGRWNQISNLLPEYDRLGTPDLAKLPPARYFKGIGFVAMRTDMGDFSNDIGLIFQSNPMGVQSHHHQSQNCFMLEAYSEPLAISSGHYDFYGSQHHINWMQQTRSRWGITFDGGKGQFRSADAVGNITEFSSGPDFDLAVGDASRAYRELDRSLRTIVHVRPGIFVIRDENSAPEPHTFEYNMHAVRPGSADAGNQAVTIRMDKAFLKVLFFADVPWKFRSFDKFPVPINNARGHKDVEKLWPEQWHCVASAPAAAKSMDLISVLLPGRTGEEAKQPKVEKLDSATAHGVKITHPDGSGAIVGFSKVDGESELAGLRSTKRVFAAKFDAGGKTVASLGLEQER